MICKRSPVLVLVLIAIAACTSPRSRTDPALEANAAAIELDGCRQVVHGPICEASAGTTLQIWIPALEGSVARFSLDDMAVTSSATAARGGVRHALVLSGEPRQLTIELVRVEAKASLRVPIRASAIHPAIEAATAAKRKGDFALAEKILSEHANELDGRFESEAIGLFARIALARGDHGAALEQLARSAAAAERDGFISRVADDQLARAFISIWFRRNFAEAKSALLAAEKAAALGYARGRANVPYYTGLLQRETGDLRSAMASFAIAEERGDRLGMRDLYWSVRQVQATTLERFGRVEGALAILEDTMNALRDASPCERADLRGNLGWVELLHHDPRAAAVLEEALRLYTSECDQPARAATVHVSLALAALEENDATSAEAHLAHARSAMREPTLDVFLWWLDLEGRIALARGAPKRALLAYARLEELGRAAVSPETLFRAALGEARAHAKANAIGKAIDAYLAAEAILDEQSLRVPLGYGRTTFLAENEASARELVALLVAERQPARALEVARAARARLLERVSHGYRMESLSADKRAAWYAAIGAYQRERDALDAESGGDWKLPADRVEKARASRRAREERLRASLDVALAIVGAPVRPREYPAAEPHELLLAYFPASTGWIAFARDGSETRAQKIAELDASREILAERMLQPFAEEISRAEKIRVLAHGASRAIDVHMLPFRGEPLIASKIVTYGVDLARVETTTSSREKSALIVADPRGDLPLARSEAENARVTLASRGFTVELLLGDRATSEAVRDAYRRVSILHYAGHGVYAGFDGTESALPLASGARLTAGDILALEHVPAEIVLSACETARSSELGAESIGLAQAFLAAGAEVVVAASRPIEDELARAVSDGIHRAGSGDLAADLRLALLPLLRGGRDISAFRVFVP